MRRAERPESSPGFGGEAPILTTVLAVAHPNIALSKYWGKRLRPGNFPAVPSLSITLDGMTTRTRVTFDASLADDIITIGGVAPTDDDRARVVALLDRVRAAAGDAKRARVESTNDFPTASGLASSASGFAALALAATSAAKLDWTEARVSDLARRGSASAARSIFGGFVELPAGSETGPEDEVLAAQSLAPSSSLDVRMLVCVVTEERKGSSSRHAMELTRERSPYYSAWMESAPRLHEELKSALAARDVTRIGELAERSALAMHASAIAAGVVYFRGATLDLLACVRELRARGVAAYATIDAGPHVKVLVTTKDAARARTELERVSGVLRVIEAKPGEGARLETA